MLGLPRCDDCRSSLLLFILFLLFSVGGSGLEPSSPLRGARCLHPPADTTPGSRQAFSGLI